EVSQAVTVKLKWLGRRAVVKGKVGENTFEVEVGNMKMKVPRHDVAEVVSRAGSSPVTAARAKGISVSVNDDLSAPSELNVIGFNVDDATREVERFVDRAFLAGMPRVRIVHGSGMGILRKALRQSLQKHPHVETVTEPPQNQGGSGATVVELKVRFFYRAFPKTGRRWAARTAIACDFSRSTRRRRNISIAASPSI